MHIYTDMYIHFFVAIKLLSRYQYQFWEIKRLNNKELVKARSLLSCQSLPDILTLFEVIRGYSVIVGCINDGFELSNTSTRFPNTSKPRFEQIYGNLYE